MSIIVNKRIRDGLSCSLTVQVDMGVKVHDYMVQFNDKVQSVTKAIGWLLAFVKPLYIEMTKPGPSIAALIKNSNLKCFT